MYTELLHHIQQYILLNETEQQVIAQHVKVLQLKKKALILKPGEICRGNYFVAKGCLRMYFFDDKGVEQTTQFAIENWWISDYTSLTLQKASDFYLQTVEESTILFLENSAEDTLFKEVPKLERYFRLIFKRACAASQYLARYNHNLSREAHYRHFSKSFPHFVQRIPQYMLASFLGFTPEFLSKIRAKKDRPIS
ncbi:cyclic nucleotide-binding protein [Pedobacter sp. PACM 27299]|uniref:Crp/Fnr family transcriptional regulator n=1 Tax=Pedobacter sp. PACM 27299 TaxID=1727164 RepID=UPI0007059DFF|nr:Crp/Fnr family transcriptional regulator [Pedobacter sp. PACM 27299]ALL06613.1 cyclic nucleotide-binding protein [Pedobacter sp. PACM 27299]